MKTRKTLAGLQAFLDENRRAQHQEAEAIRALLVKLKKKEMRLKQKLEQAETPRSGRNWNANGPYATPSARRVWRP